MIFFFFSFIQTSIALKFYKELQEHGADDLIKQVYGDLLTETEEGKQTVLLIPLLFIYNVTSISKS